MKFVLMNFLLIKLHKMTIIFSKTKNRSVLIQERKSFSFLLRTVACAAQH